MGMRRLIDALAIVIDETLKGLKLPKSTNDWDEPQKDGEIQVFKHRMASASDKEKAPYVLLQILNGADEHSREDDKEFSVVTVRGIVVTFNRDSVEGALSLVEVIERIRFRLESNRTIGGRYTLQLPFEWLIYPEDTAPYHIGELSMTFTIESIPWRPDYLNGLKW